MRKMRLLAGILLATSMIGGAGVAKSAPSLPVLEPLAQVELVRSTSKAVRIGPRGGRYYINRNGKKTYCGKKNPRC